jgi:ribosomal protein S18 acetylase RimI-like enzyme
VTALRYRPAQDEDAPGIARVHVKSWQTTYAGLIPEETLANLSVERRTEGWLESLRREANYVFVAIDGDEIVGFVAGGPEREGAMRKSDGQPFDAELYAIYILSGYQAQGAGSKLFHLLTDALFNAGFARMLVWVLADNEIGRRFYEAKRGVFEDRRMIRIVGVDLEESGYGWDLPVIHEYTR